MPRRTTPQTPEEREAAKARKLANLKPFKKGEPSPYRNDKGRPPGPTRKTLVRRWLEVEEEITNPLTKRLEKLTQQDIMVLALISKARKGDLGAYKELMDTLHGKVADKLEVEVADKIRVREVVVVRKTPAPETKP